MSTARRRSVYGISRVRNSVQRITEAEAAKRFSAAVTDFSAKDLASITDKTIDTSKSWKAQRRCPHLAQVINMARELPEVREWLISEITLGRTSEFDGDPRNIDAIVRATIAAMDRRDG